MCKNVEEERTNTKLRVSGRPGDAVGRAGIPGPAASPGLGCLRHFPCAGEGRRLLPRESSGAAGSDRGFSRCLFAGTASARSLRGGSEAGPGRARRA